MNRYLALFCIPFCLITPAYTYTQPPVHTSILFSHGIADAGIQGLRYQKGGPIKDFVPHGDSTTRYLFTQRPYTFDYPYAGTDWRKFLKASLSSLGQESEIALLRLQYQKLVEQGATDIILMGVSLGASIALNFVAHDHPEKIRALILESPFDRAVTLAHSMLKGVPYGNTLAPYLLKAAFPFHRQTGDLHPDELVQQLPLKIPILFICSYEDTTIPCTSVFNLFKKAYLAGHTDVYFLLTNRGDHAKILWGPDGKDYQECVHAFLAHYALPHEKALAEAGKEILESCKDRATAETLMRNKTPQH